MSKFSHNLKNESDFRVLHKLLQTNFTRNKFKLVKCTSTEKSNNTLANIDAYAISITCTEENNRDIVKQSLQLLNKHNKFSITITATTKNSFLAFIPIFPIYSLQLVANNDHCQTFHKFFLKTHQLRQFYINNLQKILFRKYIKLNSVL